MNWSVLTLAAFATYYLSYSISNDEIDGPWNAFKALRNVWTDPKDWKARGIRCIVCVSCWVALLWALLLGLLGYYDVWIWPIVWLGLAGASVVIGRYWQR